MVLVDTNIFLEIILGQNNAAICKQYLQDNRGSLHIRDFSKARGEIEIDFL